MDFDFEIYKNKNFSSLCKDIVSNSENRKSFIEGEIKKIISLATTVSEAMVIYPLVTGLIDAGTKNDEQLIKLAGVLQKIVSKGEDSSDGSLLITEEEKKQLLELQDFSIDIEDIKEKSKIPTSKNEIEESVNNH